VSALRAWADSSLFREAPAPPPLTIGRLAAGVAIALCGVLVVLLRLGLVPPLDSVWAEDGGVFLAGALNQGFLDALTTNYAGYLHVVPRLLAEPASWVSLDYAAEVLAIEGACVAVLCGFVVWWASAGHLRDRRLRGLLAAMVVLLPVVGYESLANLAYLWWFMLFAAFWLLLWRPASLGRAVLGAVFLAMAVMSAPLALVLAPLAALRAVAARDRRDVALVAGFFAGAVVQLVAIAFDSSPSETGPGWDWDLLPAYLLRVVGGLLFGQYGDAGLWIALGPVLIVLLAAAFAFLVAVAARSGPARPLSLIAIALSVTFFLLGGYQRDIADTLMWPSGDATTAGARHTIAPVLLLLTVVVVQLEWRPPALSAVAWRRVRGAVVAVIAVVTLSALYVGNDFRSTPRWSPALEQGRADCAESDLPAVVVPVAPPPWGVSIPCREFG